MENKIVLATSILGADPLHLDRDLKECEATGEVEWVQVDVMDGHFTPNLSFGPGTVAAIRKSSKLFIDVHMMVSRPLALIEPFAKSGSHLITVHLEAEDPADKCIALIKKLGVKAGLAIKPSTPIEKIEPYLSSLDLVLVMTVEPGFAGQAYIKGSDARIKRVREMCKNAANVSWLEVDGGIGLATIPEVVAAGANALVCGSAMFKERPAISVPKLRQATRKNAPGIKV